MILNYLPCEIRQSRFALSKISRVFHRVHDFDFFRREIVENFLFISRKFISIHERPDKGLVR
jgi:hypothetical protein